MHCSKCEAAVAEDGRFCEKCGTPVDRQTVDEQQAPSAIPNAQESRQDYQYSTQKIRSIFNPRIHNYEKIQIVIVLSLGLLAVIILFSSGYSMSGIKSVGGKTMEELFYRYMGRSLMGVAAFVLAGTVYFLAKMTNKCSGRHK